MSVGVEAGFWGGSISDWAAVGSVRASINLSRGWTPDPQRGMSRSVVEVSVGGEELQVVMEAEAREQGVDGPELDAVTPAGIADVGRRDMIIAVRRDHRQRREALHDRVAGGGTAEALEQFLQDEPGRVHRLPGRERLPQTARLWSVVRRVSPERERPDAGVDEETHPRERSAL